MTVQNVPLEVVQTPPGLPGIPLLLPGRSLPLLGDLGLLEELADGSGTGTAREALDDEGSEDDATEADALPRDVGGGAVDQSPAMVDDLDNGGQLAVGGRSRVVDENDAADGDEPLEGRSGVLLVLQTERKSANVSSHALLAVASRQPPAPHCPCRQPRLE